MKEAGAEIKAHITRRRLLLFCYFLCSCLQCRLFVRQEAEGSLGPLLTLPPGLSLAQNTLLVKPAFWKAIRRKHLPGILAALRTLPHAGCPPLGVGEASVAHDRTCAWLGCANPACRNTTGGSERGMNVLRCGRCRWVGPGLGGFELNHPLGLLSGPAASGPVRQAHCNAWGVPCAARHLQV